MNHFNRIIILIFACFGVVSSNALAVTITVNNNNDSGSGSLRNAIAIASAGDIIDFNLPYPATITLGSTLTIGANLTISGPGATNLAVSGNHAVRVFYVNSGVTMTISGVTVKDGRDDPNDPYGGGGICNAGALTLISGALSGNSAGIGGGIANYGTLTVRSSTISGNSAYNGVYFGQGGGIANDGALTIENSTLSGNSSNYGGGMFSGDVPLTITSSTLSGNSATYDGGGLYQEYGTVTMTNSTLSGNTASGEGGGIRNYFGSLALSNSTLSSNSASAGGGIYNYGASVVTNSTLSGNHASVGGGIYNFYYALAVINSTLAGNSADTGGGIYNLYALSLKNTIIATNSAGNQNNCSISYPLTSEGHNLSDDYDCYLGETGDMNSTPAGLDPHGLQNNGGPTKTIALLVTSPALDAIPVTPLNYCTLTDGITLVSTDQRGVGRPQGLGCDIGAYEQTRFSTFTAKVDLQGQGFALNSAFTLSAGSAPIDPVTQTVQLQIGPYFVAIPAGSFHQAQGSKSGSWTYAGTITGVSLNVQISVKGGGYQFKATGSPVNFSGASNPMPVAIGIGVQAGSAQVIANF